MDWFLLCTHSTIPIHCWAFLGMLLRLAVRQELSTHLSLLCVISQKASHPFHKFADIYQEKVFTRFTRYSLHLTKGCQVLLSAPNERKSKGGKSWAIGNFSIRTSPSDKDKTRVYRRWPHRRENYWYLKKMRVTRISKIVPWIFWLNVSWSHTVRLCFIFSITTPDAAQVISAPQRDKHKANKNTHDDWDWNPGQWDWEVHTLPLNNRAIDCFLFIRHTCVDTSKLFEPKNKSL